MKRIRTGLALLALFCATAFAQEPAIPAADRESIQAYVGRVMGEGVVPSGIQAQPPREGFRVYRVWIQMNGDGWSAGEFVFDVNLDEASGEVVSQAAAD